MAVALFGDMRSGYSFYNVVGRLNGFRRVVFGAGRIGKLFVNSRPALCLHDARSGVNRVGGAV